MAITKKVTITLTPQMHEKARNLSKKRYGKQNLSGLISNLLHDELRKDHDDEENEKKSVNTLSD